MTGFLDLSTSMTLNDLEPLKKRFLVNLSQFLNAVHISTLNCDKMTGDRPRLPAYEIFSIQRRFQQSKQRREGGTHQGLQHSYSAQIIVYVAGARYMSITQISCQARSA